MRLFEKVRITDQARSDKFIGQVGVVIGIGEDEGSGESYSVSFPDYDHAVAFWDYEVEATGAVVDESEAYGDEERETVRVAVDEHGRGRIVG